VDCVCDLPLLCLGLGLKLELRFVKSLHFVSDFSESILEPKSEGCDLV